MKKLYFLPVLCFLFYGCEIELMKEEDESVKRQRLIEQFSCKVDGKLWVADEGGEFLVDGMSLILGFEPKTAIPNDNSVYKLFAGGSDGKEDIYITLASDSIHNRWGRNSLNASIDMNDKNHAAKWGEIIVHDDTTKHIVKCTFQFNVINRITGAEINVTDGQLKFKYQND